LMGSLDQKAVIQHSVHERSGSSLCRWLLLNSFAP
jgi:hypothetical protein